MKFTDKLRLFIASSVVTFTVVFLMAIIFTVLTTSCGKQDTKITNYRTDSQTSSVDDKIKALQDKVAALQGTQTQINNLITSDYASCPNSGNTSDPLINKICKVAQAATVEAKVLMKGELAAFETTIGDQITAISNNLVTLQTTEQSDVTAINTQISTINSLISTVTGQITTLQSQMTNVNSAISALQVLTNSINNILAGTMTELEIGIENVSAGPLYESILRRVDKTVINAYVQAYGPNQSLANNSLKSTSGSPTITVALNSHGFSIGDSIYLTGLTGGNGFSNADVTGTFVVNSVVNTNSFTVVLRKNATSTGNFGGSNGIAYKIFGQGLGTVWSTANGADTAVRTTTLGSLAYNWIVKADGTVCYDKITSNQTFANIAANGANIVCK